MAFKRKLDFDDEDNVDAQVPKQLKLVPFPRMDADNDVAMSDSSSDDNNTWSTGNRQTFLSTASSTFTSGSAPVSPSFEPQSDEEVFGSAPKQTGLIGCGALGAQFKHHNDNCTQLPKLRMACAAGPGRARTMWSSCEQCGAIAMVDLD